MALQPDGFLPGRLDSQWRGTVPWSCLTGTVQMAACWLLLYRETGNPRFRDAAFAANRYVRGTVRLDGPPETRGAVKGSFPVSGGYVRFQYPNWACKFFIDAISLERDASRTGEPVGFVRPGGGRRLDGMKISGPACSRTPSNTSSHFFGPAAGTVPALISTEMFSQARTRKAESRRAARGLRSYNGKGLVNG